MPEQSDDDALKARLERLSGALGARREGDGSASKRAASGDAGRSARAMSLGVRVLSEFVAAILVGAVLGWFADRFLGTAPWGLVGFLFLGLAAGFWNVYRIAQESNGSGEP
jgi:ATP synthase protein I